MRHLFLQLSKKLPLKSFRVCYNTKKDETGGLMMNDPITMKNTRSNNAQRSNSGYMHLAPRGQKLMALLSAAGWLTVLFKIAII